MKGKLLFVFLLCSLSAFSQKDMVVKKDGTKIIVKDGSIDPISIDERIAYVLPEKTWEKYVRYRELDYFISGNSLFKNGAFVLGESDDKILYSIIHTVVGKMYGNSYYQYYIYDKKTKKRIDGGSFTARDNRSNKDKIAAAFAMIKKHFSDCEELMAQLESKPGYEFFQEQKYILCK